jgi:glucarate dehydratase
MKITDLRWTHVSLPTEAPRRSADGVSGRRQTRTILEVDTDEGLSGIGEIGPRVSGERLNAARGTLVGEDPYALERLRLKLHGSRFYQMETAILASGVEMACLDIQGKAAGHPVSDLLGGRLRDRVPTIAYVYRRLATDQRPEVSSSAQLVEHVGELVERYGFQTIKLKGGAAPPDEDIHATRALREAFPEHRLRLDPNGAWTVGTSLRVASALRDCDLEWLEDPTTGLDGMAEVTRRSPIPTATNMCLIDFHELSSAIAKRAVDVMLLDVYFLGGLRGAREMAAACGAFGIDVGIHSGGAGGVEIGVGIAAMLHLASTLPTLRCAMDQMYHHLEDDVIKGGPMPYRDGELAVPTGPGLGVELDPERMGRYAEAFERQRRDGGSRDADPTRPGWYPTYPLW